MAEHKVRLQQNQGHKRRYKNITKEAWSLWRKVWDIQILVNDKNGRQKQQIGWNDEVTFVGWYA